jgi:hypothetical protein
MMTHEQAAIISKCITTLWEIESDLASVDEAIRAKLARHELTALLRKYKPQEPTDAS